jgi:N-acetylneuraminic acid mutarotase
VAFRVTEVTKEICGKRQVSDVREIHFASREKTMKAMNVRSVRYRAIGGILAALLLSLPASAAWKPMAAPTSTGYAAAESINGIIYIAGGDNGGPNSMLQAFNPETNTWTSLANMPLTLYQGNGAGVINSQLYVAGGWNGPLPTNILLRYDPPSNTWTTLPGMSHLSACGATGVINSKLYVTTACNGYSGYANYLDVYDPVANTWTSLPGSANAHGAPAFGVINGKLYVAGGVNGTGAIGKTTEVYDPVAATWTTLAPMKTAVTFAASVALNGKLYVFGGTNGTANVTTVQVYDPYTNKWATAVALPAALSRFERRSCRRPRVRGGRRRQRRHDQSISGH